MPGGVRICPTPRHVTGAPLLRWNSANDRKALSEAALLRERTHNTDAAAFTARLRAQQKNRSANVGLCLDLSSLLKLSRGLSTVLHSDRLHTLWTRTELKPGLYTYLNKGTAGTDDEVRVRPDQDVTPPAGRPSVRASSSTLHRRISAQPDGWSRRAGKVGDAVCRSSAARQISWAIWLFLCGRRRSLVRHLRSSSPRWV